MNMRRALAERRKFRTNSDFELLFSENWISDIEDLGLLEVLVKRCVDERGLLETKKLLSENKKVLSKLKTINLELEYRVRTGDERSAFVTLSDVVVKCYDSKVHELKNRLRLLGIGGVSSIEDRDGSVVLRYREGSLYQEHTLGEGYNSEFNEVLEDSVLSLIECSPVPIKKFTFDVRGSISKGYMVASDFEKGSYNIYLEK